MKQKLFVVIAHQSSHAICIKATSKTLLYENNSDKMQGCIYYPSGTLPCFPENTVIQPDNQIPIAHDLIRKAHADGILRIHQAPASFESDLRSAIAKSVTLTPDKRARLLRILP